MISKDIKDKITFFEQQGRYNEHLHPIDPALCLGVDEKYPYIKPKIRTRVSYSLQRFFIVRPYIWYQNKRIMCSKIYGRENLKGIDGAVITCNHVYMFDCLLAIKALRPHKVHITAAPFNNRSDRLGSFMRAGGVMPMSDTIAGMRKFNEAVEYFLDKGDFVMFYPEQAMWDYYEKPRPFKNGAFHYAVKYKKPVIPMFITFKDYNNKKHFILHIMPAIYPNNNFSKTQNIDYLKEEAYNACLRKYEEFYNKKLVL